MPDCPEGALLHSLRHQKRKYNVQMEKENAIEKTHCQQENLRPKAMLASRHAFSLNLLAVCELEDSKLDSQRERL